MHAKRTEHIGGNIRELSGISRFSENSLSITEHFIGCKSASYIFATKFRELISIVRETAKPPQQNRQKTFAEKEHVLEAEIRKSQHKDIVIRRRVLYGIRFTHTESKKVLFLRFQIYE